MSREIRLGRAVRSVIVSCFLLLVGAGGIQGQAIARGGGANDERVRASGFVEQALPVHGLDRNRPARIVGGTNVSLGYQVALATGPGTVRQDQICGGTLIALDVVLTAAHCILSEGSGTLDPTITQYGLRVLIGSPTLSGLGGEVREAVSLFSPDSYDPESGAWDIALLKLASPTTSGTPLLIAGPDEVALWTEGRPAFPSGWGALGNGTYPDHLKATMLYVVGDRACRASWRGDLDWSTQFCAGAPPSGGRATCPGDSGGPLVVRSASGPLRLVGVTSFGPATRCGSFVPDGFSKVASDPLRSAIAGKVAEISPGTNVVGSGATTAPPITWLDSLANAGIFIRYECDTRKYCRYAKVRNCWRTTSISFRCKASLYLGLGRIKATFTRRVLVFDNGFRIDRRPTGSWKATWGWR